MPNVLATLALAMYPIFIWVLFALRRPPIALALSLLVSEMTLPGVYTLPIPFPTWLSKATLPPLAALLPAFIYGRSYLRRSAPFRGVEVLYAAALVGAFFSMRTNQDPLTYGPITLPGETFRDFISDGLRMVIVPWSAFYLGRVMFKTSRDLLALTRILVLGATIYSIPILIEIRMSPQFSNWIYGFSPFTDFLQGVRWGGYRPSVFMVHGLALSLFMLVCTLMAVGLARVKKRVGSLPLKPLCLYLVVILVLCKSTGSIVYAAALLPVVIFASPRRISSVAAVMAIVVLIYPVLRFSDLFPVEGLGSLFTSLSADRGDSLLYRFRMEQSVLSLTRTRPWFGMGGFGRNFVYDPDTGRTPIVMDGAVILCMSTHGIVGFFTWYGPLLFSVIRASHLVKRIKDRSNGILLSTMLLCCAIIMVDLVVNSTLPPLFIMAFGAIHSLAPGIIAEEARQRQELQPEYA